MTRLRFLMIAGVLVAGSLALACSSSKKDNTSNQTPAATTSYSTTETPSAGETPTAGGSAQAELDQLAGKFANRQAKLSYNYTAAGQTGTFTLYWKPPSAWRLDIGGSTGNVILVSSGGKTYFCTPGATASEGQCIESPTTSAIPLPFLGYFTNPGSLATLINSSVAGLNVDRSTRTIGGQAATCYGYGATGAGSGEYCFGSDGLLLRVSTSAGGSAFTIEATSVEPTVSDADVQPPYPVTSIGG